MRVFFVRVVDGRVEASIPADGGAPLELKICARCKDPADCREVGGQDVCYGCATPEERDSICECPHCRPAPELLN